jgi:transcriptional antiterminator RfaH
MYGWYVVHTKPRMEALAETNLKRQDFETYLPWFRHVVRRRRAWREVVEPLFPRYLFLRLDPEEQTVAPIRSTLGVASLVGFGDRIIPVPDGVVAALQRCAEEGTGIHVAPALEFQVGDRVAVAAGPFEGLHGVFQAESGRDRVAVLLDILGQSTRVVLTRDSLVRP